MASYRKLYLNPLLYIFTITILMCFCYENYLEFHIKKRNNSKKLYTEMKHKVKEKHGILQESRNVHWEQHRNIKTQTSTNFY